MSATIIAQWSGCRIKRVGSLIKSEMLDSGVNKQQQGAKVVGVGEEFLPIQTTTAFSTTLATGTGTLVNRHSPIIRRPCCERRRRRSFDLNDTPPPLKRQRRFCMDMKQSGDGSSRRIRGDYHGNSYSGAGLGSSYGYNSTRRRRLVRVRRRYTSSAKEWEWKGSKARGFRGVGVGANWKSGGNGGASRNKGAGWWRQVGMGVQAIGGIWKRYQGFMKNRNEGRWVLENLVGLGKGLFEKVVGFLDRVVNPDLETELIIEYGIVPPSPGDKYYIDPLKDWDLTNVTCYKDSFGKNVYLQTDAFSLVVAAADFRDMHEEMDADEFDKLHDVERPPYKS